jgi:hypothetical protein
LIGLLISVPVLIARSAVTVDQHRARPDRLRAAALGTCAAIAERRLRAGGRLFG